MLSNIMNVLFANERFKEKLEIIKKMIFHIKVIKSKDDSTPILFDDYNTRDLYYMINDNINNIYTVNELHTIILKKPEDPFTRMKIVKYKFVKVKIV